MPDAHDDDDVLANPRRTAASHPQAIGRAHLERLQAASGLSRARFAPVALGRDRRTVERWRSGRADIPDVVLDWLSRCEIEPPTRTRHARLCIPLPLRRPRNGTT